MNKLLELKGITVDFYSRKRLFRSQALRAVDDVSLELGVGETLGIVGQSGCGKTTLGRVSLRLQKPTAGAVIFNGEDISQTPEASLKPFRRRMQGIFQDPFASIDPFMNVYQILEEPLIIHGIGTGGHRREMIIRVLEEVKLRPTGEFLPKYTHMLSGGQRQRLAIARALILEPQYILADEPVSMIDASNRAEILYLFKELQKSRRMGYLYITHDIATARYFCHRIAVMYLGKIVELGPTLSLLRNPHHPYTRALINAVPSPDPANRFHQRQVIPGEPPSPIGAPSGCRFHPRCPDIVLGKCDIQQPPTLAVDKGHITACHLYS
jgi:peptide/nickel transport system ATP-binding protein